MEPPNKDYNFSKNNPWGKEVMNLFFNKFIIKEPNNFVLLNDIFQLLDRWVQKNYKEYSMLTIDALIRIIEKVGLDNINIYTFNRPIEVRGIKLGEGPP